MKWVQKVSFTHFVGFYLTAGVTSVLLCGYQLNFLTLISIPVWPLFLIGRVFENISNISNVGVMALLTIMLMTNMKLVRS